VTAEQAIAAGDQDLHIAPSSCAGDQWRHRYARSAMPGSSCSSQAMA
jgi:hypothetical protein